MTGQGMEEDSVQSQEASPPGLSPPTALVRCLTVLAGVAAGGGVAGGLIRGLLAGPAEGRWTVVLGVLGYLVVGWASGGVLWAAAWLVSRQYDALRMQQQIVAALERLPAQPLTPPPQISSQNDPAESQKWQRVLAELAEISTNLLLSPAQREAKHRELEGRRAVELASRVDQAIGSGAFPQAERLIEQFVEQFPEDPRCGQLRERLAQQLVAQADRAFEGGDLALAEQKLLRFQERFPNDPRCGRLEERLARESANVIEQAIQRGDFATAGRKLERFIERFPSHPDWKQLEDKLALARLGVRVQELEREKRRIQELISIAAFDKAEAAAEELVARHGDSAGAQSLLDLVRREASAFRAHRRRRLFNEVQRYADARQWRPALAAAKRLMESQPTALEAEAMTVMMPTLEENAGIEEVRELRDLILERIKQKRYAEALAAAQDVIGRFPDTHAAGELGGQIARLKELAASSDAGTA